MKKLLIIVAILIVVTTGICFLPYGKSDKYNMMSMIQHNYYALETERYFAEFYCGERENNFQYDGFSQPKLQFGIFRVKLFGSVNYANNLDIIIKIDNQQRELSLAKNPFDNTFMCDIEKIYDNSEIEIFVKNIDENFNSMKNISQDWNFGYEKVIDKGFDVLQNFINDNKKNGNSCECYVSVIYNKFNAQTNYFWNFNIRTSDFKSKTVVFDVSYGESILML